MKRWLSAVHSPSVEYLLSTSAGEHPATAGRLDASAVYEEHADFVFRTLQHLGVRDADLDDLFQEVFIVVHRRLHTFSGASRLSTWLFGICMRVASRHRRRAYFKWEQNEAELPESHDLQTPEHHYSEQESRRRLDRLLSRLSLEQRAVFVLFEIEGQSCQEIATLLGVPVGTVHSRLHSSRKQVQKTLERWRLREPGDVR